MPTYEYKCEECEIMFEELIMSKEEMRLYSQSFPCRNCGKPAKKVMSSTNFTFKGIAEGDPTKKGNSGSHDLDYPTLDKAIGRSANRKWKEYSAKKEQIDKARKELGTNAVSVTPNGSIVPVPKQVLKQREKVFKEFKNQK